jgi:L-alanine-DL-glutamate epimerase-like enolase superfamily enzyme
MELSVKNIERTVIQVPIREQTRDWVELLVGQWAVVEICKVTSNVPGIVGYGETILYYTWQIVTDAAVARVVGTNPVSHLSDDSLGAGLQMALYDLVGKAFQVPMHALLSLPAVRDKCPISWWSTKMPPEVLAAEAKDAFAAGYLSHKFKARPWFDVRAQVSAVARVVPENYRLDIDWNEMLLSPGEAIPLLQELDKEPRIGIYEDPILRTDIAGQKFLRSRVSRPIATHFEPKLFPHWMREDALDGFVVDAGGVSRFLKEGQACASFDKNFWLQICGTGITTAFTLHLGAVLTHARWPAVTAMNIYADDMLSEPIKIAYGFADVPTGHGLGVEVDTDAIERYRMKPPYFIDLPRKLLTFTFSNGFKQNFAGMSHLWRDMGTNGTLPRQEKGANLEIRVDDKSPQFQEAYSEAENRPLGRGKGILEHLEPDSGVVLPGLT